MDLDTARSGVHHTAIVAGHSGSLHWRPESVGRSRSRQEGRARERQFARVHGKLASRPPPAHFQSVKLRPRAQQSRTQTGAKRSACHALGEPRPGWSLGSHRRRREPLLPSTQELHHGKPRRVEQDKGRSSVRLGTAMYRSLPSTKARARTGSCGASGLALTTRAARHGGSEASRAAVSGAPAKLGIRPLAPGKPATARAQGGPTRARGPPA
jgi:hypothetical protein